MSHWYESGCFCLIYFLLSRSGSLEDRGYVSMLGNILSVLCLSSWGFSLHILSVAQTDISSEKRACLVRLQKLKNSLLGRSGGSKHSFISWKHSHFQICVKGKGNFLPTAYSISKHLVKPSFSSFITGHYVDSRN